MVHTACELPSHSLWAVLLCHKNGVYMVGRTMADVVCVGGRISRQQHNVEVETRGVSDFLHLWQRNRAGFVSCAQGREAGCPAGALVLTLELQLLEVQASSTSAGFTSVVEYCRWLVGSTGRQSWGGLQGSWRTGPGSKMMEGEFSASGDAWLEEFPP